MNRVLVTGASRGIGRALVTELAARGWDVIATARREADLADLSSVERLTLDVTSDDSVAAVASEAGRVDVLVNNAAVSASATVEDTPLDVALGMFDTNVVGPLRLIKAFLPQMRERGTGTIVNVSSVAGKAAFPMNGVHAASKHALEGLSEALSLEVAPFGIRVLVPELGSVATGMFLAQARYVSPPYAELNRVQEAGWMEHRSGQAPPEHAAAMIADAIEAADSPLRVPIGQDAAWLLAERGRLDDTAWGARLRESLGL
jgi:NAD(P)-dependent dehydrogenase (short-subunit alcohol dehydrogenase family)